MPLERVSKGFKDVSMTFQVNPLTKDLIALNNATAIARSVRNIVFTLPGEKFFAPDFGSKISESLFDNIDELSASNIVDQIEFSISEYEKRVIIRNINADPDPDNNAFNVVIIYDIIGADIPPQQLEFILQPTR